MSGKQRKKSKKPTAKKKKKEPLDINREWPGWLLLVIATISFLSLLSFSYVLDPQQHWLGLFGHAIGWVLTALFGISSYIFVTYIGWIGWRRLFRKSINDLGQKHVAIFLLIVSTSMLVTLIEDQFPSIGQKIYQSFYTQQHHQKLHFHLGGAAVYYFYKDIPLFNLHRLMNTMGVSLLFLCSLATSLLMLTKTSPRQVWESVISALSSIRQKVPSRPQKAFVGMESVTEEIEEKESSFMRYVKVRTPNLAGRVKEEKGEKEEDDDELLEIHPERELSVRPSLSRKKEQEPTGSAPFEGAFGVEKRESSSRLPSSIKKEIATTKRELALSAQSVYNGDFTDYKLPKNTLLTEAKQVDQSQLKQSLKRQAEVLEETLLSFGIEAKVGQINCGPTITSFEVHPAIGVKVQKIKALENDIALNMEAKSIRILAPIPGKAAIGIEVPNPNPQEVGFKELLQSYLKNGKKYHIPVLLGKTVNGDYVMEDLAKMPHAIIAGATGSGKSVCINTIVMSILMTAKPDEIKLIMVDPKKVELTPYSRLPHMLAPVITEPTGACAALQWLVKEMENRYEILKQVGVRNIVSFNTRKIDTEHEESLGKEIPKKMHYIVCIIDELADLMMVASNDIETYIARIAQMARAVGIHLILATQRPSREVITGLIKANFPTRISFKVSSRINSQIILDETGAEMLLGNGDLLFLPPGVHHLMRAQGAYIRDEDINKVIETITMQAPPNYVIKSFDHMHELSGGMGGDPDEMEKDSLYDQALETVLSTGNASTTFLQRKLKIGYARAASIIDQLEAQGVVGPAQGSKPRDILVKREDPDSIDET